MLRGKAISRFDGLAKAQHKKALEDSGVAPFPPYTLRHTALTRLGRLLVGTCSLWQGLRDSVSIAITQRYVHPQAETIDRVFAKALQLQKSSRRQTRKKEQVGTKLGTSEKVKNLVSINSY